MKSVAVKSSNSATLKLLFLGLAIVAVKSNNFAHHDTGGKPGCKYGNSENHELNGRKEQNIDSHRYRGYSGYKDKKASHMVGRKDDRDSHRGDKRSDRSSSKNGRRNDKDSSSHKDGRGGHGQRGAAKYEAYPITAERVVNVAEVKQEHKEDQKVAQVVEVKETYKDGKFGHSDGGHDYKGDRRDDYKGDYKGDKNDIQRQENKNDRKEDAQTNKNQSNYEKVVKIVKFVEKNKDKKKDTKVVEVKQSYVNDGEQNQKLGQKSVKTTQVKEDSKVNKKIVKVIQIRKKYKKNEDPNFIDDKKTDTVDRNNDQQEKALEAVEQQAKQSGDWRNPGTIEVNQNTGTQKKYLRSDYSGDGQKNKHQIQIQGEKGKKKDK